MEQLFNRWQARSRSVQMLAGIVQNDGFIPSKEQLITWIQSVDECMDGMEELKDETVNFFLPLMKGDK